VSYERSWLACSGGSLPGLTRTQKGSDVLPSRQGAGERGAPPNLALADGGAAAPVGVPRLPPFASAAIASARPEQTLPCQDVVGAAH
jgi:hypothetical protein